LDLVEVHSELFPIGVLAFKFADEMFLVVDELLDKCKVFGRDFAHLVAGQYFEFIGLFDKVAFELIKLMREIVSFLEHLFSKDIDLGDFFEDMFLLLSF
jgi:hypothetical protein